MRYRRVSHVVGTLKFAFNAQRDVTEAGMVKSTGYPNVDRQIADYVRKNWKSYLDKPSVRMMTMHLDLE